MKPHQVDESNAAKFHDWLANRGGILVWKSHDLSNPGRNVSTPALTDGKPTPRPGWQFVTPDRHITSANDIVVTTSKVVQSFVAKLMVKGHKIVLTKGSTNKVEAALKRHGDTAHYRFASTGTSAGNTLHALSEGEDVVEICVDDSEIPLADWVAKNSLPQAS